MIFMGLMHPMDTVGEIKEEVKREKKEKQSLLHSVFNKITLKLVLICLISAMFAFFTIRYGEVILYSMIHEQEIKSAKQFQENNFLKQLGN